jgi:arylsulfatase A-like enzyme
MLGKYLNGFALADDGYVPPGWDKFRAIFDPNHRPELAATAYYDYYLVGTGPTVHYGRQPRDYSTDVLGRAAVRFVESTPTDEPLFLYFSPTGAHSPFKPAPRDIGKWHHEPLNPAATHLTRHRPAFWPDRLLDPTMLKTLVRRQHETLMSVDDQIGAIMDALGPERLSNTLFVYLSDNGLQFGEHGLLEKYVPYSGSTDVPMVLRWDGHLPANSRDTRLVTNADLTATIADVTNVRLRNPDGVSLFVDQPRQRVVLEAIRDRFHPSYCGIRTKRYTFVEYDDNSGAELYDHAIDANELVNRVNSESYADRKATLRAAAIDHCSPTPPGFNW